MKPLLTIGALNHISGPLPASCKYNILGGIYAIACATALSLGQDPGTLVFSQSEMRRHLFKMLKEKKLTMFPVLQKKRSVTVTEGNPIAVQIFQRGSKYFEIFGPGGHIFQGSKYFVTHFGAPWGPNILTF